MSRLRSRQPHDPHQPNHSGLRGSSTVFTFSSLIVPLPIRSLMSPSVAPETLPAWGFTALADAETGFALTDAATEDTDEEA